LADDGPTPNACRGRRPAGDIAVVADHVSSRNGLERAIGRRLERAWSRRGCGVSSL